MGSTIVMFIFPKRFVFMCVQRPHSSLRSEDLPWEEIRSVGRQVSDENWISSFKLLRNLQNDTTRRLRYNGDMRISDTKMYERFVAGDPEWNGKFFTGVLTTGIYCLPSCKARKPKRENVRFFPTCEAARSAGLRACKKCHPDDFARGADPLLETIEALVAEVRSHPASFKDARAIVHRSGFGVTRAFELFRQHFHTTPADLLLRARIEATKRQLLSSEAPLTTIAYDAGFESHSTFHENFRRFTGLTPAAFRTLDGATSFTIALPENYPLAYLRRAFSRDIHSVTERLVGNTYTAAVQLPGCRLVLYSAT